MYIIPAKFAGAEMDKIQARVKDIITKEGGQIDYEETVGKKKLAYPIKHNHQGFYFLVEFNNEPEKLKAINTKVQFVAEVIRHIIVAKAVMTPEEREIQKRQSQKNEAKNESKREDSNMSSQFNIEKQLEEKPERKAEEKAKKVKKEKPATEEVVAEKEVEKVTEEVSSEKAEEIKEEMIAKEKQEKIKLDDLDKKLDEIIDSNIF
jgi:small subunit ribosomal protein S6